MAHHHKASFASRIKKHLAGVTVVMLFALILVAPRSASAADIGPLPAKKPVPPIKTYSTVLFGGFDDRSRSYYGYGGIIYAFNRNIAADGFLFRAMGLYNVYDYDSTAVIGGKVDGRMSAFDVLLGYQKNIPSLNLVGRIYAGLDYESHRLSPDNPFDTNDGTAYGVHVRGELETPYLSPYYLSLLSSYGSAKRRYWVRGRAGYNFQGFILGPEGVVTGNRETKEQRVGGFLTIRHPALGPFELSVSGGYSHTEETRGGGSGYGTVELSLAL
jgi:hypothetical protein